MQQFRRLPSLQELDTAEPVQEYRDTEKLTSSGFSSFRATSPLISFPAQTPVTTEQQQHPTLSTFTKAPTHITGPLKAQHSITPLQLTAARVLRIPASQQKQRTTGELEAPPRLSPRLRHSLALTAVALVLLFTLVSLAPLDNGQSALPIFRGIGSWVKAQQASWNLQAQIQPPTPTPHSSQPPNTQYQPALPPDMNLPNSQYVSIAQQDALNAGIPPDYFTRQINQESGFNPYAYSPSGAEGIAQFMPATAAGLGINPWDPIQALNAAAHLMASYANNYGGNFAMALAAYNAGSGTVQYAVNACGSNWISCLPGQTQNYIYVIMGI